MVDLYKAEQFGGLWSDKIVKKYYLLNKDVEFLISPQGVKTWHF